MLVQSVLTQDSVSALDRRPDELSGVEFGMYAPRRPEFIMDI